MSYWIFQANPKHYDIDGALDMLDRIHWRVPQYTEEIRSGDNVLIWRSGKEAGVVGVGTVQSDPELLTIREDELRFILERGSEGLPETRAVVSIRAVDLVAKSRWVDDPILGEHQIVRAPMGTVFKLTEAEWALVVGMAGGVVPPSHNETSAKSGRFTVFSWKDRKKDVYPLAGGYGGYVETFRGYVSHLAANAMSVADFVDWMQAESDLSATSARLTSSFLRRVGLIEEQGGHVRPAAVAAEFLESGEPAPLVAQIHQRAQYVGELMARLADGPSSVDGLLDHANSAYGTGWTTNAQIQRRRGWLQSAGLIEEVDEGLALTRSGRALLEQLEVHPASASTEADADETVTPVVVIEPLPAAVVALQDRLIETSRLNKSPDDFEHALAEAFQELGFQAEKLGGSGKTDVVADAELGSDHSYRIIIDGKTTGSGGVGTGQIDWDTIDEHRQHHDADYVIIAGPDFSAIERQRDRAERHGAILMTARDLSTLLAQHARNPFALDDYRKLFEAATGEFDIEALSAPTEERERSIEVVQAVMAAVEDNVGRVGPVSARDLYLLLSRGDDDLAIEQDEIEQAVQALASPLIEALVEEDRGTYRPAARRSVTLRRLSLLHEHLSVAD